jgi:hypothetical protein
MFTCLGIMCSKHPVSKGYAWRITITDQLSLHSFSEQVSFSVARKRQAMKKRLKERTIPKMQTGFIPHSKELALVMREELLSIYGKPYGSSSQRLHLNNTKWTKWLSAASRGTKRITYTHILQMSKDIEHLSIAGPVCAEMVKKAKAGWFVDSIAKIEKKRALMVDCLVPCSNSFIGNCFVNHNSQGLTLDNVEIDLSRGFASGQAYVALSRMKSLEGLALTDAIDPNVVKADPDIVRFYDEARSERS